MSLPELTRQDLQLLGTRGITADSARAQLEVLRSPPTPPPILRACVLGDGIRRLPESDHAALLELWRDAAERGRIRKFVPASGAATRMFTDLVTAEPDGEATDAMRTFFEHRDDFAFAAELLVVGGPEPSHLGLAQALLGTDGLDYGERPKALIPFHTYPTGPRTAFAEHLVEAAGYVTSGGSTQVHFTVTPSHLAAFEELLAALRGALEARLGVGLEVDFSTQDPASDTLCLGEDGAAFHTAGSELLLRPAGHGALLTNLQLLGGDIVVVKNIDNILPEDRQPEVVRWKRLLIGALVQLEEVLGVIERRLASGSLGPDAAAAELGALLDLEPPAAEPGAWVADRLRRPLRVCGMVRNEGEPGGGPFWIADAQGLAKPQIVESAQIDRSDPVQATAWDGATHFNPVDLVCSLRDRASKPYDLARFIDPATAFVSRKEHEGRGLWALERPGLWNGAMAGWNTVFVEVPAATFAPVKTVLDLLRPEHLPAP
ncbi:MAG: DUF4301 family protein [Acidobacteria bacterium]|nr:DUF4301 family protein [Acidobacteriota bacterium]